MLSDNWVLRDGEAEQELAVALTHCLSEAAAGAGAEESVSDSPNAAAPGRFDGREASPPRQGLTLVFDFSST
jgi:hypothetical protein